jgi:hypothetical protein
MPQSLLDHIAELAQRDYRDGWERLCQLEGSEEAARSCLRACSRRYSAVGFSPESAALCKKLIEHFADVCRDRLVGRCAGHSETKRIPPDLIRPATLHFDPDEVKTKDGVTYVDVRIEPDPQIPNQPISQIPDQEPLGRKPGDDWSTAVKKRVSRRFSNPSLHQAACLASPVSGAD